MENFVINRTCHKIMEVIRELYILRHALRKGEDISYDLLILELDLKECITNLEHYPINPPESIKCPKKSENSVSQLLDIAGKIISGIDKDSLYAFPLSFVGDDSESVKGHRVKVDISVVKDKGKKRFLF